MTGAGRQCDTGETQWGGADNCTRGKGRQRLGDKYNSQKIENILCMYTMCMIAELLMCRLY